MVLIQNNSTINFWHIFNTTSKRAMVQQRGITWRLFEQSACQRSALLVLLLVQHQDSVIRPANSHKLFKGIKYLSLVRRQRPYLSQSDPK